MKKFAAVYLRRENVAKINEILFFLSLCAHYAVISLPTLITKKANEL